MNVEYISRGSDDMSYTWISGVNNKLPTLLQRNTQIRYLVKPTKYQPTRIVREYWTLTLNTHKSQHCKSVTPSNVLNKGIIMFLETVNSSIMNFHSVIRVTYPTIKTHMARILQKHKLPQVAFMIVN